MYIIQVHKNLEVLQSYLILILMKDLQLFGWRYFNDDCMHDIVTIAWLCTKHAEFLGGGAC